MVYYQGINVNTRIPAAWLAAHYDMTQQGYGFSYATDFLKAGGKYAMDYTDPSLASYCTWPAPYVCKGPLAVTNESGWLHQPDGQRLHVVTGGVQPAGKWQEHPNPGDPAVRAAYHTETASYPGNSIFADDTSGDLDYTPPGTLDYAIYKYGVIPQEYCNGSKAACENTGGPPAYFQAISGLMSASAHPIFMNGGDTPVALQMMQTNPYVIGNCLEGVFNPVESTVTFDNEANFVIHATAISKYTLELVYFHSNEITERGYATAAHWLVYDGKYSISWDRFTVSNKDDGVLPEHGHVPNDPLATAMTDISALQVAPGIYVREFGRCSINGITYGHCASLLNTTAKAVPIPALKQTYTKAEDFSDTTSWYDGGVLKWTTIPADLAAHSGLILGE